LVLGLPSLVLPEYVEKVKTGVSYVGTILWVSGATLLLEGGMASRGLRKRGARHAVLNDSHTAAILRRG
jgi:hypothetical protein